MKLDRFVKLAILLSAAYAVAGFLLKTQIASAVKNPMVLPAVSALFIVINISLLMTYLFRQGTFSIGIVLLNIVQTAVFCLLFVQLYEIPGATHFSHPLSPVPVSEWIKFVLVHLLKAVDLTDIADPYGMGMQQLKHTGIPASVALFCMYIVPALFILGIIFKLVTNRSEARKKARQEPSAIIRWVGLAGLAVSVALVIVVGWGMEKMKLVSCAMWSLDNIVRMLDVGDAFQIFNLSLISRSEFVGESGKISNVLMLTGILLRLTAGFFAVILGHSLYLRILGSGKSVEELTAICESSEHTPEERIQAMREIEDFGSFADSAIPILVKILADINGDIRRTAAEVLKEVDLQWAKSEDALEAIPNLARTLGSKDKGARIAAAEALGEFGPVAADEAIHRLADMLESGDSDVRAAAVETMRKIGTASEEAIPKLVKMVIDSDEATQASAVAVLEKIGPTAIPNLVKLLTNDDADVRKAVVDTLDRIDPQWSHGESAKEEIAHLLKKLEENFGPVRIIAVEALGSIGPAAAEAIPSLIKTLVDGDEEVRNRATGSLDKIDSEWPKSKGARSSIRHFAELLADADGNVREAATELLEKIDPKWQQNESARKAIPLFAKTLAQGLGPVRIAAAEALEKIGPAAAKASPYLIKAMGDGDAEVRSVAVKALWKVDPDWQESEAARKAVPSFVKALTGSDWRVCSGAMTALGEIGPGAAKAVPYIVKSLIDNDRNVRNAARASLKKINPGWTESKAVTSTITYFIIALSDSKWSVRLSSVEVLGEIGPGAAKAAPYLVKATKDNIPDVRNAAKDALKKIDPEGKLREKELTEKDRDALRTTFDSTLKGVDMNSPDVVPQLVNKMADSDITVRNAARKALDKINPKWTRDKAAQKAIPQLLECLSDSKWIVRSAALGVLGEFGPAAAKAVPRMVKLQATDGTMDVRSAAQKALDKVDPDGKLRA
ncbi:MAG: HEAT repeat domain-containing protein [Desulfobacterales bacterium]|nr:HEAT repeat domain-containing protein [Desulfobacterales bacterium]